MAENKPWSLLIGASALMCLISQPTFSQDQTDASQAVPDSVTQPQSDAAYVPPVVEEPPLPDLPATPVLATDGYPDCREDYQKIAAPFDKAIDLNRCTALLDAFYRDVMTPYSQAMISHQKNISALYSQKVGGEMKYSAKSQQTFFRDMMAEHAASDPDGAHQAAYRALSERYQKDRAYVQDRYCFNTGCGGYPVPVYVAVKEKSSGKGKAAPPGPASVAASTKDTSPSDKKSGKKAAAVSGGSGNPCGKSRKKGSALGGMLGGALGSAAGLKGVGKVLAGAFTGVLVGEIACQLDEKEQKQAADATVEVTKKEEVGAVATWQSPTRAGVSGSSTVTALVAQPNGVKCLNITDVAIVEGVETRVGKRMCRKPGDSSYVIMA